MFVGFIFSSPPVKLFSFNLSLGTDEEQKRATVLGSPRSDRNPDLQGSLLM